MDRVEQAIERVRQKSRGRTRYEGAPIYDDEALVEEIERLRSSIAIKDRALEPFANLLKAYEEDDPLFSHVENHYVVDGIDREDNQDDVVITVGDLRRASQALQTEGKSDE